VVPPWSVIVTSNLRLLAFLVAGMFQPISTSFDRREVVLSLISYPSLAGSNGWGFSAPSVTSAMYQCPAYSRSHDVSEWSAGDASAPCS